MPTAIPVTAPSATPKTAADYYSLMLHAIGNPSSGAPSTGVTLLGVLNEAIRELFDFHDWEWRKRPPALLSLVGSQSYVALPSDFGQGQLIDVSPASSVVLSVRKAGLADIGRLRGEQLGNALGYVVAVAYLTQTGVTSAPGQARLEIWPTPSANATDALRITYKSGPVDISAGTDVPNIPRSFEGALAMLARGILRRYEFDGDLAEYALAMQRLEQLKSTDGMVEPQVGEITGGAIAQGAVDRHGEWRPFTTIGRE